MHGFGGHIHFQSCFIWIVQICESNLMSLEELQKWGHGRPHFIHKISSEIVGLLCSESHQHCCWNWTVNIHEDRVEKKVVNIVMWWHYKQEQLICGLFPTLKNNVTSVSWTIIINSNSRKSCVLYGWYVFNKLRYCLQNNDSLTTDCMYIKEKM